MDLLYVHPNVGWVYENIPMGIPGLMNSVECTKLGLYEDECVEELISEAKILAIDLQWYLALPSFFRLVRKIKKINPNCKIICGGITATIFAKKICSYVDFVIVGDAEKPFPLLVDAILTHTPIDSIPNIVSKDFSTEWKYTLTREDYDNQEYIQIGWFPTLKKLMKELHSLWYPFAFFPWLSVFKGCIYHCERCYGNPEYTNKAFKRGLVFRSPERVAEDLDRYEKEGIKRVYCCHDFISVLGEDYAKRVLNRKRILEINYEFFTLPIPEMFGYIVNNFEKVNILLHPLLPHGGGEKYIFISKFERILKIKPDNTNIFLFPPLKNCSSEFAKSLIRLKNKYSFYLLPGDEWYSENIPHPFAQDMDKEFERVVQELPKDPFGNRRHKIITFFARVFSKRNAFLIPAFKMYDRWNSLRLWKNTLIL